MTLILLFLNTIYIMITRKQLEKTISARRKLITEKVRKAFYIDEELLEQVDDLLEQADVRSRNEFVNQALKFYIGYLTSEKVENYMLTTISSVMHATVKDTENRMARAMYKLAVETSKLSHVIAYSHEVDEQALGKLQAKCAEEVKRLNGAIRFEDAYKYQQEDNF